ncbi:MAG TPA: SGNH/GDSL hydrolase family protein [Planctomycetaceae bacterium]|nr:SGNH/GDSL hydrolase family protein [Planctomycetaceae bacterium]
MPLFRLRCHDRTDSSATVVAIAATTKPPARGMRRRWLFWSIYPLYLALLGWVGLWIYGFLRAGGTAPKTATLEGIWSTFYPELLGSEVRQVSATPDDRHVDVLLLGGSVLEQVGPDLQSTLTARLGSGVRVCNLARSAHTTRDSLLKHRLLRDKAFDLVVVYHGINDVRMNCCPPGVFRDDYTHCAWYRSIERRTRAGRMTLTNIALEDLERCIGLGAPSPELLDWGAEIKTPAAFRRNVTEIVEAAQAARQPVLLMTFAYYLPENYTRERFERGELDYGSGPFRLSAELWGRPENVAATIDAHNAVIRQVAADHPEAIFVDMQAELPKTGRYFSDVCHLTPEGCRRFADRMTQAFDDWLRTKIEKN